MRKFELLHEGLGLAAGFAAVMIGSSAMYNWLKETSVAISFEPSLARLEAAGYLPPEHLMNDETCADCHGDINDSHNHSMHRFSSFNNPAYKFSVEETRDMAFAIQDMQQDMGITVLMVEHDMSLVSRVSTRVLALADSISQVSAAIDASVKFSRDYPEVFSESLGLDGIRHIIQPYATASWLWVVSSW